MNSWLLFLGSLIVLLHDTGAGQIAVTGKTNQGSFSRTPEIELLEPKSITTRGLKLLKKALDLSTSNSSITVKGVAKVSSGVAVVRVNGTKAMLNQVSSGTEFSGTVLLTLGRNDVEIEAIDSSGNKNTMTIVVTREEIVPSGRFYALVMAVQDYRDQNINPLEFPINDARELMNVLIREYGFDSANVRFLKNPGRKDIIKEFDDLRKTLSKDDNLLVFYAGHGQWDEGMNQGYWLPSDATPDNEAEWLSNSDIRDRIQGIKTRHTLLISDACFSGGIFRTRDPLFRQDWVFKKIYETPSRGAMTSGLLKETPDKSVFVEYLIKRLRENEEPYLYAQKLYISLKEAVINNSPIHQIPMFGVIYQAGDEGGDFVFIRK